jgi:ABC-type multidrug transport system fused ATPase/permease subunit
MTMKKKSLITKKTFMLLWQHVKPFKKRLILVSALGILSAIANGFVPYITGLFFDSLIAVSQGVASEGFPLWLGLLALWGVIQLLSTHFDWFIDRIRRQMDIQLHLSIQARGFSHLLLLPMSFYKSARLNEAIEVVNKASWRTSSVLRTVVTLAPQLMSVFIGIILAATINLMMAGILLLGVALYSLLLTHILQNAAAKDDEAHATWNRSWNDAAAVIQQVESVKQSATEEDEIKKIDDNFTNKIYQPWKILQMIWSNVAYFQRLIVFMTQMAIFVLSVELIREGAITVGELVALNGYALMFFGPFVQLGHSWQSIQNGLISVSHSDRKVFSKKAEEYHPKGAVPIDRLSGKVEFKDVSYAYDAGDTVLSDITFAVNPGETIAFVGASGVGKSTAISLVSGYHFPTDGEVLVDGIDTHRLDLKQLRKHIGVVPQEIALFNESIEHNIKYGTPEAAREQVIQAAKDAHIHEFVESLEKGYDTLVGERGIKLSVGQKQRVAIARAMLRNPSILILDEPTSALDAETEELISQSLKKLMEGRTTFIIAHRLSTVRSANTILVFKEGKIVERGTHDELVNIEEGEYRHLYDLQIGLRA